MAAYAALVSLLHIINQIKHHPRPPISLDKTQVESLTENVTFLQEFLEDYSSVASYSRGADVLEGRIAEAAYAAEDVIESCIVGLIAKPKIQEFRDVFFTFYEKLEKVIERMDFIKKEVMDIKEKTGVQHQLLGNSRPTSGSLRCASTGQNNSMVGFDDVLLEIMDKLTGGHLDLQIIPIVGMGGIGKTTLARNIYENQVAVKHFDILVWVTISQEYKTREILSRLLHEDRGILSQMNEDEIGNELHKKLFRRRYLIVIDDIWDIELWDQLKSFFPNNKDGSRIMLTTRLSVLASQICGSRYFQMNFLDEDESWKLLCQTVFGKEGCPLELEKIGKKIARNCRGLPLSIVVIGGLLAKSKRAREYWEYTLKNLNSIVNLEDNERCSQVLYMSYNSLPVYLKPCFLYMGVFAEDSEIHASELIKLWVAEGFLKPIGDKSPEEVAEVYLKELVDRNLIFVHKWNFTGKIKLCKIHDLLRDLCLREAQKRKFLRVMGEQSLNTQEDRSKFLCAQGEQSCQQPFCIRWHISKKEDLPLILHDAKLIRSLTWEFYQDPEPNCLAPFKLLRVSSMVNHCKCRYGYGLENIFHQVNLRYLSIEGGLRPSFQFPSSVSLLWNLQTLIVRCFTTKPVIAPSEIWEMPLLRHVKFWRPLVLPHSPTHGIVLENLQTLSDVYDLNCCKEVVKRIPNIKKLGLHYTAIGLWRANHLKNLGHLHKLESLDFFCDPKDMLSFSMQNLTFPHSLKKLALQGTHAGWEELTTKIGSLPLLQVLKLKGSSFTGSDWETVEGQFCSLKFLLISSCNDLENWTTDSAHFPRLEHLVLENLKRLKEIPSSVGDIPTLQSIRLDRCSGSAMDSAKRIEEEQEELGNESLQIFYRI